MLALLAAPQIASSSAYPFFCHFDMALYVILHNSASRGEIGTTLDVR